MLVICGEVKWCLKYTKSNQNINHVVYLYNLKLSGFCDIVCCIRKMLIIFLISVNNSFISLLYL